jgi:hypothetical protein
VPHGAVPAAGWRSHPSTESRFDDTLPTTQEKAEMIRRSPLPDDDSCGDRKLPESVAAQQAEALPIGVSRKPRGVPVSPTRSAADTTYFNPAQVAEMWGVSRDKVLEFIRTGELEAFNVASKKSRRPQFKIPLTALQAFQERRSGRDPARFLPPQPSSRRTSRKSSSGGHEYF